MLKKILNRVPKLKGFILAGIFILPSQIVFSQTCGFGCLGMSGVYGGYSIQKYKADGLNSYIQKALSIQDDLNDEFGRAKGIRVGANIFRAKFDNYFLTAKGFYQFLKEKNEYPAPEELGYSTSEYTLNLDHWGVGVDFGFPIAGFLDWKLIEGGISFYMIELKNINKTSSENIDEVKYKSSQIKIGYYVGSGLLIQIIEDYISLEGTASYNIFKIEEITDSPKQKVTADKSPLLEGGEFGASIQLNLGIPL